MVAKFATGETEEDFGPDDGEDPHAKALGKKVRCCQSGEYEAGAAHGDCASCGGETLDDHIHTLALYFGFYNFVASTRR
jgi:hypothetical protein